MHMLVRPTTLCQSINEFVHILHSLKKYYDTSIRQLICLFLKPKKKIVKFFTNSLVIRLFVLLCVTVV